MAQSHSLQPPLSVVPDQPRSGSPPQRSNSDHTASPSVQTQKSSGSSSSTHFKHSRPPPEQSINIRREGWLNKYNVSSGMPALHGANYASTNSNWRLVRAVLQDGILSIYKPPSDIGIKAFDFSVPSTFSQPPAYNHQHLPTSAQNQNHTQNANHKRITSTSALSTRNQSLGLHQTLSNSGSIIAPTSGGTNASAPIHLQYNAIDLHPELKLDGNNVIIGGSDEAICHTIIFCNSPVWAKTAVLLLPLLTDIVYALDILTAYTNTASQLFPNTGPDTGSNPFSSNSSHSSHARSASPLNSSSPQNSANESNGSNHNNSTNTQASIPHIQETTSSSKNSNTNASDLQDSIASTDGLTADAKSLVTRLQLIVETMQDNFPGMLLDTSIFSALLKLVDSVSLYDYQVSTELKKTVFLKQKSMTDILAYASHQESMVESSTNSSHNNNNHHQSFLSEDLVDTLDTLLNHIDSANKHHFTMPVSNSLPNNNLHSDSANSLVGTGAKFGSPNFFLQIPPDVLLDIPVDLFAKQIYYFHLSFSKNWSPTFDISLLFNTDYKYNKHSPLVFNSTNLHFLGSLLIDHLFNVNQKSDHYRIDSHYRGRILAYWIKLGNFLKNCGDMVGWLSIATVICSIPVLRLRSVWCYVSPGISNRVIKEWAPVVFDLERRLMVSDITRKSTFHVLAPQGIGKTYPKERVVPFFGDLCVKFEPGSTYKQCESRLNRIRTAFDRWDYYLEHILQDKDESFDQIPQPIPVIQRFLYALLTHHYEAPVNSPETILKMSLVVEPNYLGQYLKYHYSQKSSLSTGAFSPLLFTTVVPAFRLIPKSLLLNIVAASQTTGSKRTLRSSSSRSGDSSKNQSMRVPNGSMINTNGSSAVQRTTPSTHLVTGYLEIDTLLRSIMTTVSVGSPLLHDVFDILNVGTRVFHLGNDIILKNFDEETKKHLTIQSSIPAPSTSGTGNLAKGSNPLLVSRHASNQIASHDPTALGLSYGAPKTSPRHPGTNVSVFVKAANLERLVDILVLGVSDFSSFLHEDDMNKYPEIIPVSNANSSADDKENESTTADNGSSSEMSNRPPSPSLLSHPTFKVEMDLHTMTFFATYRSFCSATLLLESFRKRFVGAQSAALSIVKHLKMNKDSSGNSVSGSSSSSNDNSSTSSKPAGKSVAFSGIKTAGSNSDSSHFPNWDPTCDAEPQDIDWRIVAQIQIGVLEACHLWVSQYFSDFSNDIAARDQFLDLLRNFEVELQTWKDAGVLLRDDYKYYYETIEALHRKLRKLFIKKSYRPIDTKKLLPAFPLGHQLEWIPLNGDIPTLEQYIDDLDTVAAEYFNNVSMRDWMEVFEILEAQGSELSGFFNYKAPMAGDDDSIILDIYSYLESFKNGHDDKHILNTFPRAVRELFKFRNNIVNFFTMQICDAHFKRDERVGYMASILKMLGILRKRMSNMDVFFSETNPLFLNEDIKPSTHENGDSRTTAFGFPISPHVPSFLESAIYAAVIRPESRYFANSWILAAKEISRNFGSNFSAEIASVDVIVPEIPEHSLNSGRDGRPNLLTPCIGWLFERLFEIVLYLPNMCVENGKLINFDKHRYTYNIICSMIDAKCCLQSMESRFQLSAGRTNAASEFISRMAFIVSPKKDLFKTDRRVAHQTANRELKEHYPKSASKNRVFTSYTLAEVEKVKRDSRQREVLERQSKEIKKAISKSRSAHNIDGSGGSSSGGGGGGHGSGGGSYPDRKTGKSRFGGFLKAVRPISMAFSGSFAPQAEKIVHPDDLPSIFQGSDTRFKLVRALKLTESDVTQTHVGNDRTLFKVVNKGVEYWFQATSEYNSEEWVRALETSRKHANLLSIMSPVSSKVFGVPISIACTRQNGHSAIPIVVDKLLSEIEDRAIREVGLYRIPGSLASVNALKAAFDSGEAVDMKDDRWYDVNTLTGCFKLYLRELPEPILTAELLPDFVACAPISNTPEGLAELSRCVYMLPLHNYNLLKRLVEHLGKVTSFGDYNKMHAVNLAIIFSMSLLPSSSSTALMNNELGSMQTILKTMIISHPQIFVGNAYEDEKRGGGSVGETSTLNDSKNDHTLVSRSVDSQYSSSLNTNAGSASASGSGVRKNGDDSVVGALAGRRHRSESADSSATSGSRKTGDASVPMIPNTLSSVPFLRVDETFEEGFGSFDVTNPEDGEFVFNNGESSSSNNKHDGGEDEDDIGPLSTELENSRLAPVLPRSNLRLAEGRNKRFSSLILPSEFTPPPESYFPPTDDINEEADDVDDDDAKFQDVEEDGVGGFGGLSATTAAPKRAIYRALDLDDEILGAGTGSQRFGSFSDSFNSEFGGVRGEREGSLVNDADTRTTDVNGSIVSSHSRILNEMSVVRDGNGKE